jgi:hypothetical protein
MVTLQHMSYGAGYETWSWLRERSIEHEMNLGKLLNEGGIGFDHVSYGFSNDADAVLFKLTFSKYL